MVNGILVNGVFVNTPGAYGEAYFPPVVGNTVPLKSLLVLAELPWLEKAAPVEVTSKEAFDQIMPLDLEMLRMSSIIYAPANDDRVLGGPASVWLCNVRPSTQAWADLDDAAAEGAIRLKSTVWGPKGNQTFVTLALDTGVYTITIARDGVTETFTAIEGDDLFSVQYTDTDLTTCVAEYAPGGDFVISGTKTLVAVGSLALGGHAWDGVVTITPSAAPGAGETFTATVTGVNEETGLEETVTALSWAAGESDPLSTTVKFSSLTSIAFTASAGTPTFTLEGEVLRAEPSEVPTVGSLVEILSNPPYSAVFTVTAVSSLVNSVRLDHIDPIAADEDIKGSAYTVANVVQTIVLALGASALVTATALAGGGAPVAVTDARLVGGSAGSTASDDWEDAFTAARMVPARVVVPMSTSSTVHALARNHAVHMSGPGAYDCNVWVGAAKQETLAQLGVRTQALNSRLVSLVAQEIEREGPLGTLEWLDPQYLALLGAALQCGTRQAVTAKIPAVNNFRNHASWSSDNDKTEAHNKRVTILGRTLDGAGGQIRFLRALTTFWGSSDPTRTDVRPVESISELLIFARSYFRQYVGTETTAPLSVITKEWLAVLRQAKALGIIQDYDATTARAVRLANVTTLRAKVVPVFSNDFIKIEVGVVPTLEATAGSVFQLALAA